MLHRFIIAPQALRERLRPALVMAVFLVSAACGSISVAPPPQSDSAGADTTTADGVGVDAAANDTISVDSAANDGQVDGSECSDDKACASLKGQTPCRQGRCVAGVCALVDAKPETACSPLEPLGACESAVCGDAGACVVVQREALSLCVEGSCTHVCKAGICALGSAGDWDDDNPCTVEACNPLTGVVDSTPITDATLTCEPGNPCQANGFCIEGKCAGQPKDCSDGIACSIDTCDTESGCKHTPNSAAFCDDGDPCTVDGCDLATDCTATGANDGAACSDGKECTKDDACGQDGVCGGVPICACAGDTDCDQSDLCEPHVCVGKVCIVDAASKVACSGALGTYCQSQTCNPSTGSCEGVAKNEGKPCDDGDACSTASSCVDGTCKGSAQKDCNDQNACTNDSCVSGAGCSFEPNTQPCNDNNQCTSNDACDSGSCKGLNAACDDGVPCTINGCDEKTGKCSTTPADLNCVDNNPCTDDKCDATVGCVHTGNDAGLCDDGDPCTADACKGSQCASTNQCDCTSASACNDNNPCTADTCTAGKCVNDTAAVDGKACDNGDKCQLANSGVCSGGGCKSGNKPKSCSELDGPCGSGACDPIDGTCKKKPKTDGTPCDADGTGCTTNDACKAGDCTAGKPIDCSSKNEACKVATCASTGANTNTCKVEAKPSGSPCEDGNFCTDSDTCDSVGTCKSGKPKTCAELSDACNLGACDEAKKTCVASPKALGVGCDDNLYCTEFEACNGKGQCADGLARECAGNAAACKTGYCDEAGDACKAKSTPSGSACDDGNLCTSGDKCTATGACGAGTATICKGDACNAAACDGKTGLCKLVPLSAGTVCDDGQKCTAGDACDGNGGCKAGPWDIACGCQQDAECNDNNPCTKDTCSDTACTFKVLVGNECDDGDGCSVASGCDASGKCVASSLYDCGKVADACNDAVCVSQKGSPVCQKIVKKAGTACDDGAYCTAGDACNGKGGCVGLYFKCAATQACAFATCQEAAKGCVDQPSAKGTACDDGNACTAGDVCDGATKCLAGDALPNFSKCDDGSSATSGDFCLSNNCKGFSLTTATGVLTSVAYSATAAAFYATASTKPATTPLPTTDWQILHLTAAKGGGTLAAINVTSAQVPPMLAVSDHVAVGKGGQVWLLYSSAGAWKWSASLTNVLAAAVAKAHTSSTGGIEWRDVDSIVVGSTLYVTISGKDTSGQLGVMASCSGSSTGTSTFTCLIKKYASWYLPVGASASWYKTSPFDKATYPAHDHLVLSGTSTTPTTYTRSSRYTWDTAGGMAAATVANIVATNQSEGSILRYPSSGINVTNASTLWATGPVGAVWYQKQGSPGYWPATVVAANQGAYVFRDVFTAAGAVILVGDKPGASSSIRIPVLLVHRDIAGTQTGAANWIELELKTPPSSCTFTNGVSLNGGDSNGSSFVVGGTYCNTQSGKLPTYNAQIHARW